MNKYAGAAFLLFLAGCQFLSRENEPPALPQATVSPSVEETIPLPTGETVPITGEGSTEVPADTQITETQTLPDRVKIAGVPFTSQAPLLNWDDDRYQDGCEEASILIAMRWVKGISSVTPEEATQEIADVSAYELEHYGFYNDTNATDSAQLMRDYYGYQNVEAKLHITAKDIMEELAAGHLVLVPVDGRKLNNPYYTAPGPDRHELVIIGYDRKKNIFITQDPGTRRGREYVYPIPTLEAALVDYPSGVDTPLTDVHTAMIVVRKD